MYEHEFPLDPNICYLNHAAVAPWPQRTKAAVEEFATENVHLGATHYPRWMSKEFELRQQLKALINAPSTDDIAFQKNTSEGLSTIAYGISWKAGDQVVITNQEFPSNRIVWESLKQFGVDVIEADITGDNPEQAITNAISKQTRLLSVSSVQFGSGIRLNLHALGETCKKRNVLYCIDAIQSVGALETDVEAVHADFLVADAHKWMLGPEGIAVMFVAESARDKLTLNEFGWHMVAKVGDYDEKSWEIARSARRFECGSPNMLGVHAMSASLSLLLEVGVETVETAIAENTRYLIELLSKRDDIELLSPTESHRRAGIVTFKVQNQPTDEVFEHLKSNQVICAHRGGGIRFSPHFYTQKSVLENAVALIP
ncbi:MAG: aminotransferase class V-fold PLP-dependent enzyme [Pseudomonadales bacterium]|nr:aminotransferase class V-fold PLP-dependent enzyme [Pseudomonadales bacterium]